MAKFKNTPLFGGAITVDLPVQFADVSKVRQVPDHQEVWIDQDGFTSVIFDITERVGPEKSTLENDGEALTTHLEELVDPAVDELKVWNTVETQFTRLSTDIPAYTLIATQSHKAAASAVAKKQRDPAGRRDGNYDDDLDDVDETTKGKEALAAVGAPDFTAIILTLLRLEHESTDVLVTINVPHIRGAYDADDIDLELGRQGKLIGDAVEHAAQIWETLEVHDWSLFDEI